jgi:hypothetical protein
VSVVFGCPGCGRGIEGAPGATVRCARCGAEASLPPAPAPLAACLRCGGELYRHRDFNQKLGLAIVAAGAAAWFATSSFWPLATAAAVDLALYFALPDVAICYRCKAHHRELEGIAAVPRFDLERHEHYRFQRAREEGRLPPRESGSREPPRQPRRRQP